METLARIAGVEPSFVAVPRQVIAAAGGQLVGDHLYFGEYLDLPPHTERVDKAMQLARRPPTPLEAALREGYAWYTSQPRRPMDYAFEDGLLARA